MATAATIISRAMRLIGQVGSGESPTTAETADGLTALNALLDSWRNKRLMCYAMQEETLTLAASDGSYTIGPSGDLNTTRPVSIEHAYIVVSNVTYPVQMVNEAEWATIPQKTSEADWPDRALYRPTMATGTLLVYPVPNATRTMKLVTRVVLTVFSASSDSVSLPPGWEDAMAFNLAVALAPEFETVASNDVKQQARDSLAAIMKINRDRKILDSELGPLLSGYSARITTDER